MTPIEGISGLLLLSGAAFGIVGAVGALRFPDVFTRMHATAITDTLCVLLVLAGLSLRAGAILALAKLALILLFLWCTTPTATHALAKAALHGGERPKLDGQE